MVGFPSPREMGGTSGREGRTFEGLFSEQQDLRRGFKLAQSRSRAHSRRDSGRDRGNRHFFFLPTTDIPIQMSSSVV